MIGLTICPAISSLIKELISSTGFVLISLLISLKGESSWLITS